MARLVTSLPPSMYHTYRDAAEVWGSLTTTRAFSRSGGAERTLAMALVDGNMRCPKVRSPRAAEASGRRSWAGWRTRTDVTRVLLRPQPTTGAVFPVARAAVSTGPALVAIPWNERRAAEWRALAAAINALARTPPRQADDRRRSDRGGITIAPRLGVAARGPRSSARLPSGRRRPRVAAALGPAAAAPGPPIRPSEVSGRALPGQRCADPHPRQSTRPRCDARRCPGCESVVARSR
jgi:hypothetical protein